MGKAAVDGQASEIRPRRSHPGTYSIEYRASDPSGNLATSSRTVIVRAGNDDVPSATSTAASGGQ